MERFRKLKNQFHTKSATSRCDSVKSVTLQGKINRRASMDEKPTGPPSTSSNNNSSCCTSPRLPKDNSLSVLTNAATSQLRRLSPMKSPKKDSLSDFNSRTDMFSEGVKLTAHQRQLVKEAWQMANKKRGNSGLWIFKWLFANHPHLKQVFGLEMISDDKLEHTEKMLAHAKVFSDVLEMIVDSVEALDDSMGPLLVSYGSKHVRFAEQHGFKPEYWDAFAAAMCEYGSKDVSWKVNLSHDTAIAWRLLVYFMVSKVKEGYYLEKERQDNAKRDTTAAATFY